MNEFVSTGEAARRLGVARVTIQRWVDLGFVSATRTQGGHRRIALSDLRRALSARQPQVLPEPIASWVKVLLAGDPLAVRAAMVSAHRHRGSWNVVAEEIGSALAEIGRFWEIGACRVFEEHRASEALHRAAASCASTMRRDSSAKDALLFSAAGERHTLGLSLAELVAIESGWNACWLGEGPPIEELELLVELKRPQLLIVSASSTSTKQTLEAYQSALECHAIRQKSRLVLAGGGPWRPSLTADRVDSFTELAELLKTLNVRSILGPDGRDRETSTKEATETK